MVQVLTVQDIFEMRQQKRFEEAYEAVLPMYKEHHGHYMTLAMFWTATDVMRLRIDSGKVAEAEQIFTSLINIYPNLDDKEDNGARTLIRLALLLANKEQEMRSQQELFKDKWDITLEPMQFSLLNHMTTMGQKYMNADDWEPTLYEGRTVPSFGERISRAIFNEVKDETNIKKLQDALLFVEYGIQYRPNNRQLNHYKKKLSQKLGL